MKTFLCAAALAIILCLFCIPVWSQLVKPETSPHLSARELAVLSARIKNQSDNTIKVNLLTGIIKSVVSPEMIVLFGSYATGTWVEDRYAEEGILYEYISDYDFLVIGDSGSGH